MTVGELIALANHLSQKMGNYAGTPSIDDSLGQLDWAMKILAEKARFEDHSVRFNLKAERQDYKFLDKVAFSKRVIRIKTVYVNGVPLTSLNGKPGLWSINELDRRYPGWRNSGSATPTIAVSFGRGSVMLYPTPDEDAAQLNNHFVYAEIVPGYLDQEDNYYRDTADLVTSPYSSSLGIGSSGTVVDISTEGGSSFTGGGGGGSGGGGGGGGDDGGSPCDEAPGGIGGDGHYLWPCWADVMDDLQLPDPEEV